MRKTIAACIAATFAVNYSTTAIAEESFIAPLVEQSVLLDIDADTFVVIVGERGHVLISGDGENFTQKKVPTHSTLTSATVVGNHIWAVGHDAVILHSSDKGESWQVQNYQPDLQRPFLDVLFLMKNTVLQPVLTACFTELEMVVSHGKQSVMLVCLTQWTESILKILEKKTKTSINKSWNLYYLT
ncbi:YCF48-related protein [Alteromonas sp. KUL42]|uniref:WD40/YVTN/BNR-like repeat-containing protein n=1 Tax=Alteromonas sp. KUL42 TaxID=2480797 RepID=UPI001F5F8B50|nr:YCF48-related protein [Alteromonas sp. KUL42]